jgi:hypothetical protein
MEKAIALGKKKVKKFKVLEVLTKSGEKIIPSRFNTIVLSTEGIKRYREITQETEVDKSNVKEIKPIAGSRYCLTTIDGKTYEYRSSQENDNKMVLISRIQKRDIIPYTDIQYIKIKRFDSGKTILITASIIGALILIAVASATAIEKESERVINESEFFQCGIIAIYKFPNHPYVKTLRKFRDRFLKPTESGRLLVDLYYEHSPTLARVISKHEGLRVLARISLIPVVCCCQVLIAKQELYL